jgi:hypothetical protein
MTQVIVDAAMRSKFQNFRQPLDLCDESGTVVAHLVPVLNPKDYESCEPPPTSPAELKRRREEKEEFTTAEMLNHLENL